MREFRVVVMGATGFTGQLVARYLAQHYTGHAASSVRWAIAGRSLEKLEEVRRQLAESLPEFSETLEKLDCIVADSHNQEQLDALTKRTDVVMSTVGPFMLHGTPLVEACIRNKTDYCDITGETPWVQDLINRYQAEAERQKVRLVCMSGFDSIPSDLGAKMLVDAMRQRYNVAVSRIDTFVTVLKGGISGGTLASMLNMFDRPAEEFKRIRRAMGSPYALLPPNERPKDRQPNANIPWYASDVNRLTAPFIMSAVNSQVVHRSSYLQQGYGPHFQYSEQMGMPLSIGGVLGWISTTLGVLGIATAASFSWTRSILKSRGPQPGQGPTESQQKNGKFRYSLIARGVPKPDGTVPMLTGMVGCDMDPGYSGTARMLAESALCLALDSEKLPDRYGFLTPASCGGQVLIERLRSAGFFFEVNVPEDGPTPRSNGAATPQPTSRL